MNDIPKHDDIDHDMVSLILPVLDVLRLYHRHSVEGLEHVPSKGRALLVVNHSLATYDITLLWAAIHDQKARFVRGLADRLFFKIPGIGPIVESLGAAEGSQANAERLLLQDHIVCVAPGGMREALRPSSEKYRIDWERRTGFVKLAIATQSPIILAACPKADDLFDVYPSALTRWAYSKLKIPVFFARGIGPTPVPRPIKLVHYLSRPIHPPPIGPDGITDAMIRAFHLKLSRKMKQLMARGVVDR